MNIKTLLRLGAGALAAVLAAGMTAGCTSGDSSGTSSPGSSTSTFSPDADAIAAEPKTLSFLALEYDSKDFFKEGIEAFEKAYDKKVEILKVVGDELWSEKVAAQIAAQDPIDVFYIKIDQYLTMYNRNFLTPLDGYVDVNAPGNSIEAMDKFVKFDGKYYAAGLTAIPYVLYYNRDIMEANGFDADEPLNRYNDGTWTWDSFKSLARECQDTESGIVGMENMFDEVFLSANGASAVTFENGKYELNIGSAAMRSTLEMLQDIYNKNVICGPGYVNGQNKFLKGKAAMHGAYSYEEGESFAVLKADGTINIDYGVAPFPSGPDNDDGVVFGHSSGFAVSNGSKAPHSAGVLINYIVAARNAYDESCNERLLPGSKELYDTLGKNLFASTYSDGILDKGFGAFYLLYYVRQGGDISQVLAEYTTNYSKMVKDANDLIAAA